MLDPRRAGRVMLAAVLGSLLAASIAGAQPGRAESQIEIGGFLGSAGSKSPLAKGLDWSAVVHKQLGLTFAVEGEIGASRHDVAQRIEAFPADRLTLRRVVASLVVYPRGLTDIRVRPYLTVGGGLYWYSYEIHPERFTKGGAHAGWGIEMLPSDRVAVAFGMTGRAIEGTSGTPVSGVIFWIADLHAGLRVRF